MASRRFNTTEYYNRDTNAYSADNLAYEREYVPYEAYAPNRRQPYRKPDWRETPIREVPVRERELEKETRKGEIKRENLAICNLVARRGILFVIFAGLVLVGVVMLSARASALQYRINELEDNISVLENDIMLMNINIDGTNSIDKMENYAIATLGMHYPTADEYMHLAAATEPANGQASLKDLIFEKIYGQ